jgi:hypothetical protein
VGTSAQHSTFFPRQFFRFHPAPPGFPDRPLVSNLESISKLKYETPSASFERHGINERRYFPGFCLLSQLMSVVQSGFLPENRF